MDSTGFDPLAGFVDPGLLDGFKYLFATAMVVVVEIGQIDHQIVQIHEADRLGVYIRVLVEEFFSDTLYVSPFHRVFQF
jgi:hypothetical protein